MRKKIADLYRSVFPGSGVPGVYPTPEALVEALRRMETGAVEQLLGKTEPSVRYLIRRTKLPETLTRDILHDALVILVKKIRDDAFDPEESAPSTYLIAIARNLVSNQLRLRRPFVAITLEDLPEIPDEHASAFLEGRERRDLLESLLTTLGDPCARLIRLKYLDGYRDEEQLAQKLTPYNTPMALRSKRSKCFQKLVELAAATKSQNATIMRSNQPPRDHKNGAL